jgi:hypothetical protein
LNDDSQIQWLLKNSGPIIKYRTQVDLIRDQPPPLENELLSSDLIRKWLGLLHPECTRTTLHGARQDTYENVMGKLYEFGIRKGMPVLDRKTLPIRSWLETEVNRPIEGYLPVFHRTLVTAFLAMTGYDEEEAVESWTLKRLDALYSFAKAKDLTEVYVPQDTFPGFPKVFRGSPLVNPELYPEEQLKLPWIHDINAFLHSRMILGDPVLRGKVETIIEFILSPQYQALRPGYGVVKHGKKYYMMGWSVHLPGYDDQNVFGREFGRQILLLDVLGRSNKARSHDWFIRSSHSLDRFKDDDGLMCFQRSDLPEMRSGVWVLGMRMGLELDRKSTVSLRCESTFRYQMIMSNIARVAMS